MESGKCYVEDRNSEAKEGHQDHYIIVKNLRLKSVADTVIFVGSGNFLHLQCAIINIDLVMVKIISASYHTKLVGVYRLKAICKNLSNLALRESCKLCGQYFDLDRDLICKFIFHNNGSSISSYNHRSNRLICFFHYGLMFPVLKIVLSFLKSNIEEQSILFYSLYKTSRLNKGIRIKDISIR